MISASIIDTKLDRRLLKLDLLAMGEEAKKAARALSTAPASQKNLALRAAASALRAKSATVLKITATELKAAHAAGRPEFFIDRLTLTQSRLEGMAQGLEAVSNLSDPVGAVTASWERPNGIKISRVQVPLGVIGIIYESRPNVTADAGGLCLKSGNAVILRGGLECLDKNPPLPAFLIE